MTEKTSFVHTPQFNFWMIQSFFIAFVAIVFAILPVTGLYRLGEAASEELSRYDAPAPTRIKAPKPEPTPEPAEGIPVAYQSPRTGP